MEDKYHYPPEVFNLLVDVIPLLCKSKKDVIIFFRGAGVTDNELSDLSIRVDTDRENINKYEIARTTLQRINEKGDSYLKVRREIIKRVVEFEDFSTCWPADQLKAKGLVSELRRVVNVKDSFTRINKEREQEKEARAEETKIRIQEEKKRKEIIVEIKNEFFALFALDDKPQERGKLLEKVLNKLFSAYNILIAEDFKRKTDGAGIVEQIDGVISFDGDTYLVEMKWVSKPLGVEQISPHLVRLFGRADAKGIFISSSGYAETAISECKNVLAQKVITLCTLKEIVCLLERETDLKVFLRKKVQAATLSKEPFVEILS
ncbi:MAG: restriction endonuclease [Methylobacter sp.]|nr:MAG: restriction endonuclease [Methylobacter sp.]